MMSIRVGELVAYGNLTGTPGTDFLAFSGTGAISTVRSAWPQRYQARYTNPLVMAQGLFPVDTAGLAAMPFAAPPELTFNYIFLAPASYTDGQAFQYVADQMRSIESFVKGTYTLDGVANVTGMRGWLRVHDENPATGNIYKCKARFLAGPDFELIKGQPSELVITMTFGLLSEFQSV
jgi:hypothetical protein